MTCVKTITKKALHHLAGHQLVSMQEAVHMVDKQELVICSESMTYVSITRSYEMNWRLTKNKILSLYIKTIKKIQRSLSGAILFPCLCPHHIQEIKEW
jgi:hypothetical protein